MKLLLHTCCAPCSIQCVEALIAEGIRPHLYWYNPNIHPYTEYRSRLDSLCAFAEDMKLPLIIEDEYGLRSFIKGVSYIEESSEQSSEENSFENNRATGGRCAFCYRLRLEKTANLASEKGFDAFSTTLLISPYQNHELIRQIGEELATKSSAAHSAARSAEFLYRDFRPRFKEGRSQARKAGYYMQKYCGCIYSEEERYLK